MKYLFLFTIVLAAICAHATTTFIADQTSGGHVGNGSGLTNVPLSALTANPVTNDNVFYPTVSVVTNLFTLTNNASRANAVAFMSVMNVLNNPIGRGYGQEKLLFIGDSMSDPGYTYYSTAFYLDYFLRTTYGNNGNGLNNFEQNGCPALSRAIALTFFPNATVAASEAGDSPLLKVAQGDSTQNTSLVGWSINTTNQINYEALWWMQWPNGGSFTVTNFNSLGVNGVGLVLNGLSTTTNLVYTNLPIGITGTGNSMQIVSASGTNIICGGELASTNTSGVETFSYAWPGHGQLDMLKLSSAQFSVLSNSIYPNWIIFHMKNNNALSDAAYISNTIALVSYFTNVNTKVILVGTPDGVGLSYAAQRGDLQYAASLMGWYYVDLSQDFNSTNLMANNGYFFDGIQHPSAIGAEQWAADLMMRMQQLNYQNTNYGAVDFPNFNNNINANNTIDKTLWNYYSGNDPRNGLLIGGNYNSPASSATANTAKFGFISGLKYPDSYSGNPPLSSSGGFGLLGYDAENGYTIGYFGEPSYPSPDYWRFTVSGTFEWQIDGNGIEDQGTHLLSVGGTVTAALFNGNAGSLTNVIGVKGIVYTNLTTCITGTNAIHYSVPAGMTNGYTITGFITVTAVSLDVVQPKIIWTDENGTVQSVSLGTSVSSTGWNNLPYTFIRAKGGTVIDVTNALTTGTGSITYDVSAHLVPMDSNQ